MLLVVSDDAAGPQEERARRELGALGPLVLVLLAALRSTILNRATLARLKQAVMAPPQVEAKEQARREAPLLVLVVSARRQAPRALPVHLATQTKTRQVPTQARRVPPRWALIVPLAVWMARQEARVRLLWFPAYSVPGRP